MDAWLRLILTVIVLALWTDNLLRSYRTWGEHRDGRWFRAFLIGFMIELGAFAFLFGALAQLLPGFLAVARFFGIMVTGALLVVGIFNYISWRR